MRLKTRSALCFDWSDSGLPKIVREQREKYKAISRVLDDHPEVLNLVDRDLRKLSQGAGKGREAVYTSDNILRALVVHVLEGQALRRTIVRIAESGFLQDFLRLGNRVVMDFTFLDKCFKAIEPQTWKKANAVLGEKGADAGSVEPKMIRVDTTVVEANIHWPTDCSLLWDSWRVLTRWLRRGRGLAPEMCRHRFHDKKVKKLHLYITRYISSKSRARQRKVKACFRKLIERLRWVLGIAEGFCCAAKRCRDIELMGIRAQIERFLLAVRRVVDCAERAHMGGETVGARERLFSIFEDHVELIMRGKRAKPVEFGHKVLLCQSKGKFITDYEVLQQQVADCELTGKLIESHEELFGVAPEIVAADTGFNPAREQRVALQKKVRTLAIPRRVSDWADEALAGWQRFRAGLEGTISVLKRAFGLFRCFWRGFKSFAAGIGLSVFCHNVVVLCRRCET